VAVVSKFYTNTGIVSYLYYIVDTTVGGGVAYIVCAMLAFTTKELKMKTRFWWVGASVLLLLGCDEMVDDFSPGGKAALVSEMTGPDEAEVDVAVKPRSEIGSDDIPESILKVALTDVVKSHKHTSDSLTVTVNNSGMEDLEIKVNLNCGGFGAIQKNGVIGEFLLKAGKTRTLKVAAKELPIQSDISPLQIRAETSFRSAERKNDKWSMIVTPVYYYVFDSQYAQATVMTHDVMMAEYKGVHLNTVAAGAKGLGRIGKMMNNENRFENIGADSQVFELVGEGRVVGYLTSASDDIGGADAGESEVE